MFSINSWQGRDSRKKVWYVAEEGICIFEARSKQEAESYMTFLLRQTRRPKA